MRVCIRTACQVTCGGSASDGSDGSDEDGGGSGGDDGDDVSGWWEAWGHLQGEAGARANYLMGITLFQVASSTSAS